MHSNLLYFRPECCKSCLYLGSEQRLRRLLFPARLLTSEDEYKWYWHQMIYFPEKINTVSTRIYTSPTHSLSSSSCAHLLTLCMLASWSREGVVFLVLLPSSHLTKYHVLSLSLSGPNWRSLFPPLGPVPPFPKMAPPFTGSAHTPLPGSTTTIILNLDTNRAMIVEKRESKLTANQKKALKVRIISGRK